MSEGRENGDMPEEMGIFAFGLLVETDRRLYVILWNHVYRFTKYAAHGCGRDRRSRHHRTPLSVFR